MVTSFNNKLNKNKKSMRVKKKTGLFCCGREKRPSSQRAIIHEVVLKWLMRLVVCTFGLLAPGKVKECTRSPSATCELRAMGK
jgi:hypothetical protein